MKTHTETEHMRRKNLVIAAIFLLMPATAAGVAVGALIGHAPTMWGYTGSQPFWVGFSAAFVVVEGLGLVLNNRWASRGLERWKRQGWPL